jgi:flagellar motor switch protein FliG
MTIAAPATTRQGTPLAPRHKAAIAVLALDEEVAGQILAQLDDRELKALSTAVDELDVVPPAALIGVLEELERALAGPLSVSRTGGVEYVRRLAMSSLGEERARRLFAPPPAETVEPIQQLRTARAQALADLLAEEHPQIAAVVLTQLPARSAAKVLKALPPEIAAELTGRLAELEEVPDGAVLEASDAMVRALAATGGLETSDRRSEFDGLAFAAALVNEMSTDDGDALLSRVGERDSTIAARVREAMFTFDDLLRIDQRSLAPLMRAVQGESMVVALQTASEELREHFFGALSQRAAQTMREDLQASPPKRVAEVEAAQREIVEAAMRLASEGTLTLPPRGGEG